MYVYGKTISERELKNKIKWIIIIYENSEQTCLQSVSKMYNNM